MEITSISSWLFAIPLVCTVTVSFITQLPAIPFSIVEASSRTVRNRNHRHHLAKQKGHSGRRFLSVIGRVDPNTSSNESAVTYYTYAESATFLADAILHDREQKKQQQTTTIPAIRRPLEGIYTDKPLLRGQFHKWGAILYPPLLGLPLALKARSSSETAAAALLFNLAVESILVVSARLHTVRWKTLGSFGTARNLDFAAIFFGIASFYSSMGRLLMGGLHPVLWRSIEGVVWACAVAGTFFKWQSSHSQSSPKVNGLIFLVQGWATLPCVPSLWANASWRVSGGLVAGAFFGTLGALAYAFQWPNYDTAADGITKKLQREIVFGPHEMFHVGTLFMFVCFWLSMWSKISELV